MKVEWFFEYIRREASYLSSKQEESEQLIKKREHLERSRKYIEGDKDAIDQLIRTEEKISRREGEIIKSINRLIDAQKYASSLIELLSRSEDRAIMTERYINGKKWDLIGEENYWSVAQLYVMRRRAISEITRKAKDFDKKMKQLRLLR